MRPRITRYPVDRYLVENNKKIEMVNIIDDEIWNSEPALRPEDEIILKKLHDMLQSTADDLKLLSGELSKTKEPGLQIKSQPAPLDEEFNEKVHIEEIVNAKFHGHKIIEKPSSFSTELKPNKNLTQMSKTVNTRTETNSIPTSKKPTLDKCLKITKLKAVQINENNIMVSDEKKLGNGKPKKSSPTVLYDEVIHNHMEQKKEQKQQLQIQNMPSISIRSELKEQRVLNLNISPEFIENNETKTNNAKNIGVIEVFYESKQEPYAIISKKTSDINHTKCQTQVYFDSNKKPNRKIYKMSTYDSSESTNNLSSDVQQKFHSKRQFKLSAKASSRHNGRPDTKNKKNIPKTIEKRTHFNIDEWKKKLNSIYGQPSSSRGRDTSKSRKNSPKKSNVSKCNLYSNMLNNGEYIPYTKLTLGGVRVSDIEREICDIPNKNDLPLSPILDKILSSRENSFYKDSPVKRKNKDTSKILSTSDENLLHEVIDIEKTISETLSKEFKEPSNNLLSNIGASNDSYADDFEDEKSESITSSKDIHDLGSDKSDDFKESNQRDNTNEINKQELPSFSNQEENLQNTTYTKVSNLSFKDTVDIFEFVHSVNTQETGTQSISASKISLKDSQTSPRNGSTNRQPIHNDLRLSIDPKGELDNLFQLEKEFIKKLIIDEYGEFIENNIMKPSSSKEKQYEDIKNNVAASQKNTQTSPARVKSAMTSPTKTKTRTTSPFSLSLTVDRQTSPILLGNTEDLKIIIDNEPDDLGISINLSSPRFSLRLPQNSRDVLTNLDNYYETSSTKSKMGKKSKTKATKPFIKPVDSSSSVDADQSSSELSSLGEIKFKLKRKNRTTRIRSNSECSSSSNLCESNSDMLSNEILPLKSEGEVSLGKGSKKANSSRDKHSDGEMNFGLI
ncbi:unnamed protein product [Diatraea saccharalis]|uniref:Uncharacterized protein n=1 Tax=Diatraea saccharalis TaxID=40085 RepID=A0A9N9R2S0_9NEOP|nr:unnamed protein product [Diatraea saccharalis]